MLRRDMKVIFQYFRAAVLMGRTRSNRYKHYWERFKMRRNFLLPRFAGAPLLEVFKQKLKIFVSMVWRFMPLNWLSYQCYESKEIQHVCVPCHIPCFLTNLYNLPYCLNPVWLPFVLSRTWDFWPLEFSSIGVIYSSVYSAKLHYYSAKYFQSSSTE